MNNGLFSCLLFRDKDRFLIKLKSTDIAFIHYRYISCLLNSHLYDGYIFYYLILSTKVWTRCICSALNVFFYADVLCRFLFIDFFFFAKYAFWLALVKIFHVLFAIDWNFNEPLQNQSMDSRTFTMLANTFNFLCLWCFWLIHQRLKD